MKHHLITQVTFDDRYWHNRCRENDLSQLSRVCTEEDPLTGLLTVTVFTDDGAGNGTPIFSFPLN